MPRPATGVRYLADFGPLATTACTGLRELVYGQDDWLWTEAAYALWRITDNTHTAVSALTVIKQFLTGESRVLKLAIPVIDVRGLV